MKEFFARLNPMERRFVVFVVVLFFVVVNLVWVRPYFLEWGKTKVELEKSRTTLTTYTQAAAKAPALQKQVDALSRGGAEVPQEEQALQFARTIQERSARSGVGILSMGSTRQVGGTNQFFAEQIQTINVQSKEDQLVDFLYNLGSDNSLIRVRDLSIQPDPSHMQLNAHVTLVASYQKKPAAKPAVTAPASKPATAPAPAPAKPAAAPAPAPAPPKPTVAPQPSTPKKK